MGTVPGHKSTRKFGMRLLLTWSKTFFTLVAYSCDNIFDNKPMNVASQPSGPPIPPRLSSPNDIYSSPRSFSSTGLVSRFQQGSLNTTELYCGERTISEGDVAKIYFLFFKNSKLH